jgi:hypothetical protein
MAVVKREDDKVMSNESLGFRLEEEDEDIVPLKRKRRCISPLKDEQILELAKGFVPTNTTKNTGWALRVYEEWKTERNNASNDKCPDDLLTSPDVTKLNYWLSRFVAEVRKGNGDCYPPKTIHQLLAGVQRYLFEVDPHIPKLLDKKCVHCTCDVVYRNLHSQGYGGLIRHAQPFSLDEESILWSSGVLCL